jgi:hypothetical protein
MLLLGDEQKKILKENLYNTFFNMITKTQKNK